MFSKRDVRELTRRVDDLQAQIDALCDKLKLVRAWKAGTGSTWEYLSIPAICPTCKHPVGPYKQTAMSAFYPMYSVPVCDCKCHKEKRKK